MSQESGEVEARKSAIRTFCMAHRQGPDITQICVHTTMGVYASGLTWSSVEASWRADTKEGSSRHF